MSDEHTAAMRRLPVYLLLDCSGSMAGEPIKAMEMGLRQLCSDLQGDPQALETVWLSVITFGSTAKQLVPLTEIGALQAPNLSATGTTSLGGALKLLQTCMEREVRKTTSSQKGDWKPLIFLLMTDGRPTDNWEGPAEDLKRHRSGIIIGCAAGPGAEEVLKRITDTVVRLQDTTPGTLGAFMKWTTASVSTTSRDMNANPNAPVNLLPVPDNIILVP